MLNRRSLVAGACACAWSAVVATAQAPLARPEERLFTSVFQLGEVVDTLAAAEATRLAQLCRADDYACRKRRLGPVRQRVATLRQTPDAAGVVVGHIVAVLTVQDGMGLVYGLDVEAAQPTPGRARWLEHVGDHGYGIYVDGVRPHGDWIQLMPLPLLGAAWVSRDEPDLSAIVEPLEGEIRDLQPLVATYPDGSQRRIAEGSYLIGRTGPDGVELRAEVASDFDCGEDRPRPAVMPPTLRARPADMFDAAGAARFRVKYSKGC
jgi:hypothetical protein